MAGTLTGGMLMRVRSAPGSQASTRQAGIRIRYREWAKLWAQVAGLK